MSSDALYDQAIGVTSRAEFVRFVRELGAEFSGRPQHWENNSLGTFLEGLSGFAGDINGYYKNMGESTDPERITWRMAAQMLLAATLYE